MIFNIHVSTTVQQQVQTVNISVRKKEKTEQFNLKNCKIIE